jgi:methyl-accepting chemotaxis protein
MIEQINEKLAALLQGRIPAKIDIEHLDNESEGKLAETLNQLIDFIREIHEFIIPLSQGELNNIRIRSQNFLASPFKELHSHLLHLTWQATQVANGDFKQRVDFMGDFSEAFNTMVISLDRNEKLLKKKIDELENALSHIRQLEGILPICSNCKRIRLAGADTQNQDSWVQIESYISDRTETLFSHGICPECIKKLYPGFEI